MDESQLLADQPLGHKLIKKGSWLYFFMILTAPVGYLVKVLISNSLSVEDVGLFYSVLGLITLLSTYHDLGLTEALQYFLPKYWINKEYTHYKTILYITLAIQVFFGIGIAILIYFGADWLALNHFRSPAAAELLRILCFYFIGVNFLQFFNSVYMSFQDTISPGISDAVRLYGVLIFTFLLWFSHTLNLTHFSFIWIGGLALGFTISCMLFLTKYRKTLKKGVFAINKEVLVKQLKYAFWVFLGTNVGSLLGQVDQQMIINILGPKDAGYYSNFFTK